MPESPVTTRDPAPSSDRRESSVRLVAVGGGTGLSSLLRGLKRHVVVPGDGSAPSAAASISDLAAIVTVTDDGGSSGRLRREFNMLPPGDIRNCLVALSQDETSLSRLFQYRFSAGNGLQGHSFGNLFLTALTALKGDFPEAVREACRILATRGQIYPATSSIVHLDAWMEDGSRVRGETNITASQGRIAHIRMVPANAPALPDALERIRRADVITIGPGSLFTSLIPNLLVRDIASTLAATSAKKIFICNLMTQPNESLGLTASQHMEAIYQHAPGFSFDHALINNRPVPPNVLLRYRENGADQIVCDREAIEAMGVHCTETDLLETGEVVRHSSSALAHAVMTLL